MISRVSVRDEKWLWLEGGLNFETQTGSKRYIPSDRLHLIYSMRFVSYIHPKGGGARWVHGCRFAKKVAVARVGATLWDADWLQIHLLREAGLGGFTGVRSRRKMAVARVGATFPHVD